MQETWQQALRDSIDSLDELFAVLKLPSELRTKLVSNPQFKLKVPRSYVARMQEANPDDPLLRQVLPQQLELHSPSEFTLDPVGDKAAELLPGMLQKYHGRVLLVTTSACAIHCRYCFRQHYGNNLNQPLRNPAILAALRADNNLREVILSGGDPLMYSDMELATFIQQLAHIPHLQRVRLHTRLPIVLPNRVTRDLVNSLTSTRLNIVLVVHSNHAQELDAQVCLAMAKLADAGVTLLNQAVLLRGVNDDTDTLIELSERLFTCKILPYYLNMLDKVQGAAHFEVPTLHALELYKTLQTHLPGYLVPKLVQEVAGEAFKRPL